MKNYSNLRRSCFHIFLLITALLSINGCKLVELQSKWLDREIIIDGNGIDWKDYPFFYDEKTRSNIGLYNDDTSLYLCFQTMDEKIQKQILDNGLYVWFNQTGKKDKERALCFPERGDSRRPGGPPPGMPGGLPDIPSDRSADISGFPKGKADDPGRHPTRSFPQGSTPAERVSMLFSEDDGGYNCSLEWAAKKGIEIKYNIDEQERLIYELKIPVVGNDSTIFVAKASESNQIGIGFMTAKSKMGDPPRGEMMGPGVSMGGPPGGGMGGPGGDMGVPDGGPGGPGGGRGGTPREGMKGPGGGAGIKAGALKIWTNVTLASKVLNIQ